MITVHYLTNTKENLYEGDKNQAKGISQALLSVCRTSFLDDIREIEYDVSEVCNLIKTVKDTEENSEDIHVVVAVGDHGLDALSACRQKLTEPNTIVIWSGHQLFEGIDKIKDVADIIALPAHVLSTVDDNYFEGYQASDYIIATNGVAHTLSQQIVEKSLTKEWQEQVGTAEQTIGVFLGGDTIDEQNKKQCFTPEEARIFAKKIADMARVYNAIVLVTNSPRTGCWGEKNNEELDATSAAFIAELEKRNTVFNFVKYGAKQGNAYWPFLAQVIRENGAAFVTGDSTSMLSEMSAVLAPNQLNVVRVSSMNEAHHQHVNWGGKKGMFYVQSLDLEKKEMVSEEHHGHEKALSGFKWQTAADQVSDAVIKLIYDIRGLFVRKDPILIVSDDETSVYNDYPEKHLSSKKTVRKFNTL